MLVEGNKHFDEANIRASVPSLQPGTSPNINQISRNLRVANENPAKQATVLLRSGQEEATVDAVLRVVDEPPTEMSVTADNTGNAQTGRLRVGLGVQNANAFGYRRHRRQRNQCLRATSQEPRSPMCRPTG